MSTKSTLTRTMGSVTALAVIASRMLLGTAATAAPVAIPLVNPSFEGTSGWPKISFGFDDATYNVVGWNNGGSVYTDTGIDWTLGGLGPHTGGWAGYFKSGDSSAIQTTSYVIATGDTFDLTFWSACTQSGYLQANLYYLDGSSRIPFASKTASAPTWSLFTLNAQAPAAAVGQVLGIEFVGYATSGTAWPVVDDVSLSVPEPAAIMLLATGLVGLLPGVRRQRN